MKKISESVFIEAPPSRVYDYLIDAAHGTEWIESLEQVRNVMGKGVGQSYQWNYRMLGVKLEGRTTVTAADPGRLIELETHGGVESTWTMRLEPQAQGTLMSLHIEYTIPVPVLGVIAEQIAAKRNQRETVGNLKHLKEIVEALVRAEAPAAQ